MYNYTDNVCVSVYHMVCTLLIPYMEDLTVKQQHFIITLMK